MNYFIGGSRIILMFRIIRMIYLIRSRLSGDVNGRNGRERLIGSRVNRMSRMMMNILMRNVIGIRILILILILIMNRVIRMHVKDVGIKNVLNAYIVRIINVIVLRVDV
jgi:hypothetical protein